LVYGGLTWKEVRNGRIRGEAEAGVHYVDAAPVLNGLVVVIKLAELAVAMRRMTGQFTSKRLVYAPPKGRARRHPTSLR
jgi:hypothetical protein